MHAVWGATRAGGACARRQMRRVVNYTAGVHAVDVDSAKPSGASRTLRFEDFPPCAAEDQWHPFLDEPEDDSPEDTTLAYHMLRPASLHPLLARRHDPFPPSAAQQLYACRAHRPCPARSEEPLLAADAVRFPSLQ
eukprot:TRINITY_DN30853_c0_g1_i1.p2 TRINITY_DN30853_c0_g1~~TRINITY_DN30853_c0_g1_i1.p2  ORF type:complete len:136 (+),score=28.13 TRINITY_DN30853_c0_g1_i1:43-450(+)